MKYLSAFMVVVILLGGIGWCKNLYKLATSDFASPYKREVMHLAGIIPPVGAIMGWLNFEDGPKD